MSNLVVFDTLSCRDQKKIALITLNNPKALNALTLDMVSAIQTQLKKWQHKKDICMIIIKGSGEKAFCAGGDIKGIYHATPKNKAPSDNVKESLAETFFKEEYRLNYSLHQYPKPILAWGHGFVMGGGMGIFMGARFRVVTEASILAMPEISIGLYPDVGAGYFLNRTPGHTGRIMGLTGAQANATDSVYTGLATDFICHKYYQETLTMLREQSWAEHPNENAEIIHEIIESFAEDSKEKLPPGNIERLQNTIDDIFGLKNTQKMFDIFLNHKTSDPWLLKAQTTFRKGSPLSALIIDRQLKEAKTKSLKEVFRTDMILSSNISITYSQEFMEGVRALLIDKDNSPKWAYSNYEDVPSDLVDSFFKAPWEKNPLDNL